MPLLLPGNGVRGRESVRGEQQGQRREEVETAVGQARPGPGQDQARSSSKRCVIHSKSDPSPTLQPPALALACRNGRFRESTDRRVMESCMYVRVPSELVGFPPVAHLFTLLQLRRPHRRALAPHHCGPKPASLRIYGVRSRILRTVLRHRRCWSWKHVPSKGAAAGRRHLLPHVSTPYGMLRSRSAGEQKAGCPK